MTGRRSRIWVRSASALALIALIFGMLPTDGAAAASNRSQGKIDPSLLAEARLDPSAPFSVIVRGAPSTGSDHRSLAAQGERDDTSTEAGAALRSNGGDLRKTLTIVGAASGVLTGKQILQLANDGRVARIVKDEELRAGDAAVADILPVTTPFAATGAVNAPAAWAAGLTGAGIGVAILDSGVAAHPDLAGRVIASVDLTSASSFVSPTPLGDPGGHGTHVAGLIAGSGSSSAGLYGGIAPGADIISVRVIDATGSTQLSTVLHGLQWILAYRSTYHIRVANLSLGARARTGYQADLLASATEMLTFAGIVAVVAAGNGGDDSSTITTPGTDPFVLTVGATDDHGTVSPLDDTIPDWSARGPTPFDAIAKPDIVAPGRRIVALRAAGSTLDLLYPDRRVTAPGAATPAYFTLSGTSMSSAIVSGAVALLLQARPGLTPREVKAQLRGTAHSFANVSPSAQGAGLIDAFAAASAPLAAAPLSPWPVSDAFALQLARLLYGQPIVWRNLAFNNGVDSQGIRWTNITWGNITWNDLTWQNISWESFTWTIISWETISWETISWELITTLGSSTAGGWVLVD
ncbi:MAG: hypothetical protein NVS9B6_13530 [Candidatus Limnocylindrales bacterium]